MITNKQKLDFNGAVEMMSARIASGWINFILDTKMGSILVDTRCRYRFDPVEVMRKEDAPRTKFAYEHRNIDYQYYVSIDNHGGAGRVYTLCVLAMSEIILRSMENEIGVRWSSSFYSYNLTDVDAIATLYIDKYPGPNGYDPAKFLFRKRMTGIVNMCSNGYRNMLMTEIEKELHEQKKKIGEKISEAKDPNNTIRKIIESGSTTPDEFYTNVLLIIASSMNDIYNYHAEFSKTEELLRKAKNGGYESKCIYIPSMHAEDYMRKVIKFLFTAEPKEEMKKALEKAEAASKNKEKSDTKKEEKPRKNQRRKRTDLVKAANDL